MRQRLLDDDAAALDAEVAARHQLLEAADLL
jgi:hypothetical protein